MTKLVLTPRLDKAKFLLRLKPSVDETDSKK